LKTQHKTRFFVLVGATCIGKGHLVKLILRTLAGLMALGLRVKVISFGQIIRDKIKNDPVFAQEYGQGVGNGKLISDDTAISLFQEAFAAICSEGQPDIVIIDGFCRSTKQIEWASQNGFLKQEDIVVMLNADISTCHARFGNRNTLEKRPDNEIQTFYARFHLHQDSAADLRAMLMESGPRVLDIDANPDVPDIVGPAVQSALLPSVFEAFVQAKARGRQVTAA
jgi:adenylate kinase family enzyme